MYVRLLKSKMEGGKVKVTVRENRGSAIVWVKGQIIEVSEATGAKLIENEEAEVVVQQEEAAATATSEEK